MKNTLSVLLSAVVAISPVGCSNGDTGATQGSAVLTNPTKPVPKATGPTVIFDSGRGTGQYDEMTYAKYSSALYLTPEEDMLVTGIRPHIYYSNGTSGFLAFIRGEHYEYIDAEAGLGDNGSSFQFTDRHLESPVTLKAGTTYIVEMEVWTTKSVGIYTTGSRTEGVFGSAHYSIWFARSDTADHLDRGAIAFDLLTQPGASAGQ